eukprot:2531763-Prymnesium_polylepis.1
MQLRPTGMPPSSFERLAAPRHRAKWASRTVPARERQAREAAADRRAAEDERCAAAYERWCIVLKQNESRRQWEEATAGEARFHLTHLCSI